MEVILLYALFAVTTALAALYELIMPVMRELRVLEPEDNLIKHSVLSYLVFFIASILFAPIVIFPVLIPSQGMVFRDILLESLTG